MALPLTVPASPEPACGTTGTCSDDTALLGKPLPGQGCSGLTWWPSCHRCHWEPGLHSRALCPGMQQLEGQTPVPMAAGPSHISAPSSLKACWLLPCPAPGPLVPPAGDGPHASTWGHRRFGLNKNFGIWSFSVSVCIAGRRRGHCLSPPGPSPPGTVLPAPFGAGCGGRQRAPALVARGHAALQSAGVWGWHTRTGSLGRENPEFMPPGSSVRSLVHSGHTAQQGSLAPCCWDGAGTARTSLLSH